MPWMCCVIPAQTDRARFVFALLGLLISFPPGFNICWTRLTQNLGFPGHSVGQAVVQSSAALSPRLEQLSPACACRKRGIPQPRCAATAGSQCQSPGAGAAPAPAGQLWAGLWGLSHRAAPGIPALWVLKADLSWLLPASL